MELPESVLSSWALQIFCALARSDHSMLSLAIVLCPVYLCIFHSNDSKMLMSHLLCDLLRKWSLSFLNGIGTLPIL